MYYQFRFLCCIAIAVFLFKQISIAQQADKINPDLLEKQWDSKWISHPEISGQEYGVYLFRKSFNLVDKSGDYIIHVSADNRYKLYVNGEYVGNGPSRGDKMNWYFETYDIASFLKEGKNVINAIVWNFAEKRPLAQHSVITGFILQGNTEKESSLNTNQSWLVMKDEAYAPVPVKVRGYYDVGPGEKFEAEKHPWDWASESFAETQMKNAFELTNGTPLSSIKKYGGVPNHVLKPRPIPAMEETPQRFSRIRCVEGIEVAEEFLKGEKAITIPAASKVSLLIDQDVLTNAYPILKFSKGKGSSITITYAESLYDDEFNKGNREEISGKKIIGNLDIIVADGSENRTYQTLWWRTFRYVKLDIETANEPLVIDDFYSIFTAYPFEEKAVFEAEIPLLKDIWEVGWRTQRLCTGETFFDCPYYEQLQYAGDTRIQSLISTYVTGDTTMMREALISLHNSRKSFGLTASRYPSHVTQIIPTFSLVWITMVHDYWMLCDDDKLIASMLPAMLDILNWYEARLDQNGMIGKLEWWNFLDWVTGHGWETGVPPGVDDSNSSVISLQYVYAMDKGIELMEKFNYSSQVEKYKKLSKRIKESVYKDCYDVQKGLIADTPNKKEFSQQANILAILTNTYKADKHQEVMNKLLTDDSLAPASYYFSFYLMEALGKAGMANQYLDQLAPWEKMLEIGLTTFAERADPTRSDCHAWSASPLYYFLTMISGIKPNEAGFKSVKIEPALGNLSSVNTTVPHRLGNITLKLEKKKNGKVKGEVTLPTQLTGSFIWNGKTLSLKEGINKIDL
ncbi:alpha-L-rhamnosidase C-terminal domain-containing protein [Chondrinema litorale]|uniref:alpha-L-rhamnosidase-related protein n=1 Tax=Chondrinema litorale TaxID=2994555 RepID=UPI002543757C|nr:alpha-L-rhamnosidase C-terminal domain-containing protein [Chondrinema litorale]UZR93476.1 alpha-L-rhamnosidase [Chondrinema litorale]